MLIFKQKTEKVPGVQDTKRSFISRRECCILVDNLSVFKIPIFYSYVLFKLIFSAYLAKDK